MKTASKALLAALFVLNVYRAATQSLVHDEAFTWQLYLNGPISAIFTQYDANHHFLATLLMRLSTRLFGFSELALRLASLLAGGWYFITIFRLAVLAFGEGWRLLLAVALAALNPLVLDFLVAARGYGIALACLMYGLYSIVRFLTQPKPARSLLVRASISFGFAVMANLTFLIPVMAIAALVFVLRRAEWKPMLLPLAALLLLFLLISPILQARPSSFYYGASTLTQSFQVLAAESLAHNEGLGRLNREAAWKPWWRIAAIVACGAIVLASLRIREPLPRIAAVTIIASWCALFVAHHATGLLYPADRTGLYFLPLAGLLIACMAARSRLVAVFAILIAAEYALQLNWTHFYVWQYDADNRAILQFLAARKPAGPMRLGTSWPLDPSLSYYRDRLHLAWLPPLNRQGPDGDYDYYILTEQDQDRIQRHGLEVIYRGAASGMVLAVRGHG